MEKRTNSLFQEPMSLSLWSLHSNMGGIKNQPYIFLPDNCYEGKRKRIENNKKKNTISDKGSEGSPLQGGIIVVESQIK